MTAASGAVAKTPPRIVVRTFWTLHRAVYRLSGGRIGLSRPEPGSGCCGSPPSGGGRASDA